jgi:transcriptional regulator with XRE-family HTH domain
MRRDLLTLGQRLKFARDRAGITQGELANDAGIKQGDVSKIENGRILKTTAIARLADVLGVSALWLEIGSGDDQEELAFVQRVDADMPLLSRKTPSSEGVAQLLIQSARQTAPRLTWEQIQKMETLPEEFELELVDDAMAGRAPKGSIITFKTADAPAAGEAFLVRDRRGEIYFRECRLKPGGGWIAYAYRPAFPTLDSDEDGLQVIAEFIGLRSSWSKLSR